MTPSAAPLAAFSGYGIELEYMIVARDGLQVLPIADRLLDRLAARPAGDFGWSNELVLHLLELKNERPAPSLTGLAQGFQAEVATVNAMLEPLGARLMPGAMHPWMDPQRETKLWPHRDAEIYRAYDAIFDCHAHGWANIQSMQLNLPFADDAEFARLHAAVRLVLPILPALAASSPLADGRRRSELDFRMESYRLHAARKPSLIGRVIPDNATSLAGYRTEVLEPMYAEVAPFDPAGVLRHDWLNARGAMPRFGRHAIEVRVIDMQECPRADLAIAALASAAIRALYEARWTDCPAQQGPSTGILADILAACVRDADAARVDDPRYLAQFGLPSAPCRAGEIWQHLFARCGDDPLFSDALRTTAARLLDLGPLARRILQAVGAGFDRSKLAAVYGELCNCLAEDRLFREAQ